MSLHLSGGCYYYSNNIFGRFKSRHEVFIPDRVCEDGEIEGARKIKFYGHNTIIRYISLAFFLFHILMGGLFGYYSCLILSGFSSWDFYIMKIWKLTKKPSFVVVHDGVMHDGEHDNKWQSQLNYCINNASCLILLSEYVRRNIEKRLGLSKPYFIAPHGLIDYGGSPKPKISSPPSLLFLGRGSFYKGIDILIGAMENVSNNAYKELVIAGSLSDDVRETVGKIKNNNIRIIDKWLSTSEMANLLQAADVMIFPYREASQSGALTLAIQYEIPHIISNVGALPEQTNSDCAIIIDSLDSISLAKAIEDLCYNSSLMQSMKINCVQLKTKYSWDSISSNLENSIVNALKTNSTNAI